MIEKGAFYFNLRMASIKLIPKKCDCEQIKNWRPISLLSNIYKIYSKAFANRLKRNIDQNTSNTQKAYSTKKTIHKALMNILQCLSKVRSSDVFKQPGLNVSHSKVRSSNMFKQPGLKVSHSKV